MQAPRFTPSVESALGKLGDEPFEASELARALFAIHPEFGSGMAGKLSLIETGNASRTKDQWRAEITAWVQDTGLGLDLIHGRLALVALASLDAQLGTQLKETGFLRNLYDEIDEPVDISRSASGRAGRLAAPTSDRSTVEVAVNKAVFLLDDDATQHDLLRRRPFAGYLAQSIRNIHDDLNGEKRRGSFILHIDGSWGSGKTTLLGFLRQHLKDPPAGESDWIVVEYNAWSHQHEHPPWWHLHDQVVRQIVHDAHGLALKRKLQLREWWWRFWLSIKPVALATFVFAALAVMLVVVATRTEYFGVRGDKSSSAGVLVEATGFVALFTAVWGSALAATKRFSPESQEGARVFLKSQGDPLRVLRERFGYFVEHAGRPVAIFIDDLDRCNTDFVVGLIEGIQTLFRDTSVVYVIAGDRRWIEASFDEHYRAVRARVSEPGRSVGNLFLQKSFQVSVELPPITNAAAFWARLINNDADGTGAPNESASDHARIRAALRGARSPNDIDEQLEVAYRSAPDQYHVWVVEALKRELDDDIRKAAEHELRNFHPLLDRNPRAMKRFVNTYGIHRAAMLYSDALRGSSIEQPWRQLGLWTVIKMRWPSLAELLVREPSWVHVARGNDPLPSDIDLEAYPERDAIRLLGDPKVQQVVKGDQVGAWLDESAIRAFYGLPGSSRPVTV